MTEEKVTDTEFTDDVNESVVILKELQILFNEYETDEYRQKIELFKQRVLSIIMREQFNLEKEVEKTAEKLGKVYGIQLVTCEVYFLFTLCYKQQKKITKACEYAEKTVFLIEKIEVQDENTCKYWITLASLYALQLNHEKSLKLLRKSKRLLRFLLSELEHGKNNENLLGLLGISMFNIAAEQESLKNYVKSIKKYKKTLDFYDLYPQLQSENMRLRIQNCIKRIDLFTDTKNFTCKGNYTKNKSFNWPSKVSSVKATSKIKISQRKKSSISKLPEGPTARVYSNPQKKVIKNTNKNNYKPEEKYNKNAFLKDSKIKILKNRQCSKDFELSLNNTQDSNKIHSKNCSFSTKPPSFSQNDINKIDCAPAINFSSDYPKNVLIPIKEKDEGQITPSQEVIFNNTLKEIKLDIPLKENMLDTPLQETILEKDSIKPESEVKSYESSEKLEMISFLDQEEEESVSIYYKFEEKNDPCYESFIKCQVIKTCIHRADIEFDLKPFKIIYKLKNSPSQLKITCKSSDEKYKLTLELPKNTALFDYIRENIHPCLAIKNGSLILAEKEFLLLTQGNLERDEYSGWIKVSRVYPRWTILVEVQNDSKYFEINQILQSLENLSEVIKDQKYFLSLFNVKEQTIIIELPMNYPLLLLSEKFIEIENLKINFEIYQVEYIKSYSLLIGGKIKKKVLSPLLIDFSYLCNLSKNSKLTLGKIQNYLEVALRVSKTLEIYIDKSIAHQKCLSPIRESLKNSLPFTELKLTEKNLPSLKLIPVESSLSSDSQKPSKDSSKYLPSLKLKSCLSTHNEKSQTESERSRQSSALSDLPDYESLFTSGKNLAYEDYEDRIILRFSVFQNSKIFQVYMNFSDENILTFVIESGLTRENRKSYSIEIQMLCERIGFEKKYIVPLGSYILRNLLVIKDSDICYFDFTRPIRNPSIAIDKIAGLLKGFLSRKRFKIMLKNLIGKKKIRFSGHIYTVLVYKDADTLHLRLVSGFKVLGLSLNFFQVVKDKFFLSIDQFFNSFGDLGLKVLPDSETLWIKPEYLILK